MQETTLEKRINWWKLGIAGVAGVLVMAYAIYFGWHLGQKPALDAEKWGQFGDFIGGLLNPLVAFAAFYWLTQSIKIQKIELAETKAALQAAAKAQREQALSAETSIRLMAVTTVINGLESKSRDAREKVAELMASAPKDPPYREIYLRRFNTEIEGWKTVESVARSERDRYFNMSKTFLDQKLKK